MQYLDFEHTLMEVDTNIEALKITQSQRGLDIATEMERLTTKRERVLRQTYKNLTPWQKSCVARHEARPHTRDYLRTIFTDFFPLRGDRLFAEDAAITGGLAKLNGQTVMVIGHEKGHDTDSRLAHNFGMARPEGYRKAERLMHLAEQFGIPVITLIDTAGAYPGMDAEERGQARAIATTIEAGLNLRVPLIACIIGEGGSGGAIALATGNSILMMENAIYSVISPEGCASILWKDFKYAPQAAEILHLTAQDLSEKGLIDEIIAEPVGAAHHFPDQAMQAVGTALSHHVKKWADIPADELIRTRQDKFLAMTRAGEIKK